MGGSVGERGTPPPRSSIASMDCSHELLERFDRRSSSLMMSPGKIIMVATLLL